MALRILDSTAIIRRLTNLVQGNQDTFVGVWCQASYSPTAPDYVTVISKQDLDIAAYTQWAGIYSDPLQSNGSYEVNADNGGGSSTTTESIVGTALAYLTYRKVSSSHFFYRDAVLIGSTTEDLSAVSFATMLLGNDRSGGVLGPIDFFDFIEYDSAKYEDLIAFQMARIGEVVDPDDLVTFTPLASNLLDVSGNANHWLGSGNFTFVPNPLTPPSGQAFPIVAGGGLAPDGFNIYDAESFQYTQVPVGSGYSIVETVPAGWEVSYEVSNGSPHTNIAVADGEIVTVIVTNRRLTTGQAGCPIPQVPVVIGQRACPAPQPGVV